MEKTVHAAVADIINKVHAYMRAHPESELHRQGKMFGVLVYTGDRSSVKGDCYIAAFSAQLDGSYYHDGFVPPVYDMPTLPVGATKAALHRSSAYGRPLHFRSHSGADGFLRCKW